MPKFTELLTRCSGCLHLVNLTRFSVFMSFNISTDFYVAECYVRHFLNVENVNLRGYKWNETVSNRICNVSDEIC
jgi:hypothetical protein